MRVQRRSPDEGGACFPQRRTDRRRLTRRSHPREDKHGGGLTPPILFNGGQTNLYVYAYNDPVNFLDPDGRNALAGLGAAVGASASMIAYSAGPGVGSMGFGEFLQGLGGAAVGGAIAGAGIAYGPAAGLVGGMVGSGIDDLLSGRDINSGGIVVGGAFGLLGGFGPKLAVGALGGAGMGRAMAREVARLQERSILRSGPSACGENLYKNYSTGTQ